MSGNWYRDLHSGFHREPTNYCLKWQNATKIQYLTSKVGHQSWPVSVSYCKLSKITYNLHKYDSYIYISDTALRYEHQDLKWSEKVYRWKQNCTQRHFPTSLKWTGKRWYILWIECFPVYICTCIPCFILEWSSVIHSNRKCTSSSFDQRGSVWGVWIPI